MGTSGSAGHGSRTPPRPARSWRCFTAWDYHTFVTDRPGELVEIETGHRRHAVVEQAVAELKSAGLAHLPSGRFMANAAWLALTVMAHNFGRGVGILAGPDLHRTTAATLRRTLFCVPGRLVRSARRLHLRLPTGGPGRPRSSPR